MANKKRRHRFVIGYRKDLNVVYGKKKLTRKSAPGEDYAQPMTEWDAKRLIKTMPCKNAAIFELVEVDFQ